MLSPFSRARLLSLGLGLALLAGCTGVRPGAGGSNILRINIGSEPATIDPQKASFVGEVEQISLVFASLMTFDPDTLNPVPNVAESYEISSDGLTYTFKLRKGTLYSDGVEVKAQNFEYAWKRLLDPNLASDYAFTAYVIKGAEKYNTTNPRNSSPQELQRLRDELGIQVRDDFTIQFTLERPAPWFLSVAALWVGAPTRQDMVQKAGDRWTEPATYIGNGAFKLQTWEHQNRMAYVANDKYFRGRPKLDGITAVMIKDFPVALSAYKANELDILGVSGEEYQEIQGDQELQKHMVRWGGSCNFYLGFNAARPPFNNMKVRQAFAQAIDREGFAKNILKGIGVPAYSFIPPGMPGHQKDLVKWKLDPSSARRTLAEAGFPEGRGLPSVKLTISDSQRARDRAQWLQAQIRQNLGVDITLEAVEPKAYTELLKKQDTTPPMYSLGWCADYPDPQNWLTTVFSSKSTVGHTAWNNPKFDDLVSRGDRERDQKTREDLYKQAQELLVEEAPVVFLFHDEAAMLKKPSVSGIKTSSMDAMPGIFRVWEISVSR